MVPVETAPPATDPAHLRTTVWLGAALIALPYLQTLEWDFERAAPLALLPPALWAGRDILRRAGARLAHMPRGLQWLGALGLVIAAIALVRSPHPAAAVVATATLVLVGLGALLAGQLLAEEPRYSRHLLAALAVSAAGATLLHWTKWRLGAEPEMAFYPHHRLMGLHLLGGALATTALLATGARWRVVWLVVGLVTWGGLLWTGSRSPLVALLASLAGWTILARPDTRRRLVAATAAHLTGGLFLSWVLQADRPWLGWMRIWHRTVEAGTAQELTANRSDFWRAAWSHVLDSPWWGYGPDAYRFLLPKLEGAQPHNTILQWLLDFGVFGAILLTGLAALALWRGIRRRDPGEAAMGWAAIALASLMAGQLDGYFYHQCGLFTAALALGISLGAPAQPPRLPATVSRRYGWWWPPAALAAIGVLLLHSWIFYHVARARPPEPDAPVARAWHVFPSCTLGLERWIETWEARWPEQALALSRQAQAQSTNADYFHVQTAGLLLRRGDRAGALQEMDRALASAPWQVRGTITKLREQIAAAP